jgi:hypothetical protein
MGDTEETVANQVVENEVIDVDKEHLNHLLFVLTQNPHLASSTQQAEQARFTHEQIPKRASQFSLKINKRQSS